MTQRDIWFGFISAFEATGDENEVCIPVLLAQFLPSAYLAILPPDLMRTYRVVAHGERFRGACRAYIARHSI
jgi:hypothetical protein